MKINKYIDEKINDSTSKMYVITGANSGIGFECMKVLAYKHAHILMACRSINKAKKARDDILKIYPSSKIDILLYDQSDLNSVKAFVNELINKYPNFDGIIFNAGLYMPKKDDKTAQGIPLTIGTNFFGLYYMLKLLKPFLDNSKKKRNIVIQGSLAARRVKYKANKNLLLNDKKGLMYQYSLSKLGSMNVFYHFALNNKNDNISYMLSEPGVCYTNILRGFPLSFQKVAKGFLNIFTHSPLSGSLCACLLVSNDFKNLTAAFPNGLFAIRGKPKIRNNYNKKYYPLLISEADNILSKLNID